MNIKIEEMTTTEALNQIQNLRKLGYNAFFKGMGNGKVHIQYEYWAPIKND